MEVKNVSKKLPDDEELEKLFEGMSREAAREVANQNSPSRKSTAKKSDEKPNPEEYDRWGKVGVKFTN